MRIFLLAFCLLTLHSNPTWAKKREPVIVNPETVQKLADNYATLTTLGAKLDSATITVEERYELNPRGLLQGHSPALKNKRCVDRLGLRCK